NKVLVVDDDPAIRTLVAAWLRPQGFQVFFGEDGYQGVQMARTHEPDLIMLDISMPAGEGFSVQERLQRNGNLASIPIVYMSADTAAGTRALQSGAVAFLPKPLSKDTTLAIVRSALAS